METISLVLDIILVIAAVAAYLARPRIGGELVRGMQLLTIGILILGLAHLIETMLFVLFNIGTEFNEIVHRLLVAGGFIFVIAGFNRMRKAFKD
jgi:hypothetical protein